MILFINYAFLFISVWHRNCNYTIRLSKSFISLSGCSDRLPIEEGENWDLTDHRIIASRIICLSDPLMRIFLRRRNFHNFLVRLGISKNFVARPSNFLTAIASFPLIQNMRLHESSAQLATQWLNMRKCNTPWEWKLAVRKTRILDSREWCSSKPRLYDNTRIRKIYET